MKSYLQHFFATVFLILSFNAQAGVVSSQGNFATDVEVLLFNFSLSSDFLFSARTWSFGGGTNGVSMTTSGRNRVSSNLFSTSLPAAMEAIRGRAH